MTDGDYEEVTIRFARRNWEGIKFEAAMSGDTETDVINRAIGFYVHLRDDARQPGAHVAILRGVEVDRSGPEPVVRLREDSVAMLVRGLGLEDDPAGKLTGED